MSRSYRCRYLRRTSSLYDINRVETLRCPQGTLFGSGSVGGTIRYITNQPQTNEFDASVEFTARTVTDGDDGEEIRGHVNIPLIGDQSALRIVGYRADVPGYIDARTEGGGVIEDINAGQKKGVRASLLLQPVDNVTVVPRFIRQRVTSDGFNRQEVFNLFANPYTTTRPPVQLGDREQHLLLKEGFDDDFFIADITVNVEFENFELTFVQSLVERDILVSRDASALTGSVSVDLGFLDGGVLLPANLQDDTELEQTTKELRLSSTSSGQFHWLVGYYSANTDRTYSQRLPTPLYNAWTDATLGGGTSAGAANGFIGGDSPYNADLPYDLEQEALFGEVTYAITDRTNLTVGGRYYDYDESRRFHSGGLFSNGDDRRDSTSSSGFTPRVLLDYQLNDDITLNAQVSQGFRLGGVNDPLNATLCNAGDLATFGSFQDYDDETLWNYEAGMKGRIAGMYVNAAVFYSDIEDLQVTLDAGSCSSRISFNVGEAHTAGVELELRAQPIEGLEVSFAGSWLESEFDSTVRDSTGAILGGVKAGNRLASVPEYQYAATATYSFPLFVTDGDGFLSATVHHVGDRFTQPSDQVAGAGTFTSGLAFGGATGTETTVIDLELDPYTIVNVSGGMTVGDWDAILFVHNLSDKHTLLSFDRERGGRARLGFRTNQPRTVRLTIRRRF